MQATSTVTDYLRDNVIVDADFHLSHPHNPAVIEDWAAYVEDPYAGMLTGRSLHDSTIPTDTYVRRIERDDDRTGSTSMVGGFDRSAIRTADDIRTLCAAQQVDYPILNSLCPLGAITNTGLALAMMRGLNDYLLDRYLDEDSDFAGLGVLAPQDPQRVVEEIDRLAGVKQIKGLMIYPMANFTALGDPQYDVLYRAAERHGLPVTFHASAVGAYQRTVPYLYEAFQSNVSHHALAHPWAMMATLTSVIVQGVPEKFPDLDLVFLEAGIGWVPYMTYRLNRDYGQKRELAPLLTRDPEDYIREHCHFGTQPFEEPKDPTHLQQLIDMVGADSLIFTTDTPHKDYDQPEAVLRYFDRETWDRVARENAASIYDLDV